MPPGDPLALAQAVGAALDLDAEARVRLAAIARARVVEHFSRARMCAATLAVYRELLPQR